MKRPELLNPPEASARAQRIVERLLRPIERYLRVEASSGIVLLVAACVALLWANSPFHQSYEALWESPITVGVGGLLWSESLRFWINDGLMTVFFFVVGLEIRREIHEGELSDLKRAGLPIAAAAGGMIAPALIYLSLNRAADVRSGWGVPTATDIAFAVGVLALLGKRVPAALRVLLLALAIIDDIGAILIIALFYSGGVSPVGLLVAAGGVVCLLAFQRIGMRSPLVYVLPSALIWAGMLAAGLHPTIGGVVVGLLTPVTPWFGDEGFVAAAGRAVEDFREHSARDGHSVHDLLPPLRRIKQAQREALSPVVRVQAELHPWVAYGVMPLFALANAGVRIDGVGSGVAGSTSVMLGIVLGLVVGKPLGIALATLATVKLRLCALPRGVEWPGIVLVGTVAGIGFTMAIFIAGLAFPAGALLTAAKLAILVSTVMAAVVGLLVGRFALSGAPIAGAASTAHEAEASAEK